MDRLATRIRDYYYDHFDELPFDKKFHFASRLAAWNKDPGALSHIQHLAPYFITDSIENDLRELINNPPKAKINAAETRQPYFDRYPDLRGRMLALFRVRHLLYHYDIDARPQLLNIIPKKDLKGMCLDLKNDPQALAVLSTYAINYIFLIEHILFPDKGSSIDDFLDQVLEIGKLYRNTAEDTLLMIYLFTHCIIGASNFYQSSVSSQEHPQYIAMLKLIEERLTSNYDEINLDNKCEFLVCCKIIDYQTKFHQRITEEAHQSVSPDGTFIVDTLNSAGQTNKKTFVDSEHRNVLYIMSQLDFKS